MSVTYRFGPGPPGETLLSLKVIFMQSVYRNIFELAIDTLMSARSWILGAVLVYCTAAVVAWSLPGYFDFLEVQFDSLMQQFMHLGALEFILRIFVHNLIASYLAMCFVVFFGIVPLTFAVFNGLLLGWFAGWMDHVPWVEMAVMLVPHGIFEWPAMFIAFGVGMWRGVGFRWSEVYLSWLDRLKRVHCVYLIFVVPLLFVAAIIEGRYHLLELLS